MDISVTKELLLVLYSIGFGICVGILYDLFRVSRLVFHLNTIAVFVEDLIFCLLIAVLYFIFCFIFNSGQIRVFVTVAAALGWFLYYISVGKAVYYLMRKFLKLIKRIIHKIHGSFKHKNTKEPEITAEQELKIQHDKRISSGNELKKFKKNGRKKRNKIEKKFS